MHKAAIVRSVNHKAGCHNCLPSYTGFEAPMPDQHPRDTDPPSMGSVCEYLRGGRGELPDYVYMPCWLGWGQAFRRAGPYAGFLGQRRTTPLTTECEPFADTGREARRPASRAIVRGAPLLPNTALRRRPHPRPTQSTAARCSNRSTIRLKTARSRGTSSSGYDRTQQRAFDLLTSSKLRGVLRPVEGRPATASIATAARSSARAR